ncbi:transcription elongation factor [Metallosphaera tengchongensis]|uniref:Transcription elongation factor n=1 Tax=Metallosphaera tengchongensis TaxID=1532350 RepID=A0A6N0NUM8_9CREN|nr:transcription elongation factor [Metallosphaera tengchongensis]QKQ99864.1 transcription elongation factor [Metallosphaera tengchongensis]
MGGKRKKRTKIVRAKPKLPKTFECPRCGKISITVEFEDKDSRSKMAEIRCGSCGLKTELEIPSIYDEANAYGRFIDLYLEGKLEIKEDGEHIVNEGNEDEGKGSELSSETN